MIRTSHRLLVVAGVSVLVLSGCGSSPVRTGAAAVVGEDRITTTALQDVVQRVLADPQAAQAAKADRSAFERVVLDRLIEHVVITKAAEKAGVEVSGGDIDAAVDRITEELGGGPALNAEAAKAGIAAADVRQTIADIATRDALADKLTESIQVPEEALRGAYQQGIAQFDRVQAAHILVATKAEADRVLAEVKKNPDQFAAIAQEVSLDTESKPRGGDLGLQGRGVFDKTFENALFENPPGSTVITKTRFGFHVIRIMARRTVSFEEAIPDLRRGLLAEQRTSAVQELLLKTAKDLGVRVNPRFGTWDPDALDVVIPKSDPAKDFTRTSPAAPQDGPGTGQAPTGP